MKSVFHWLVVFLFVSFCSYAQTVSVKTSLDTNVILIGQQVKLSIEIRNDKQLRLQWPVLPDSLGQIEIVQRDKIDTVQTRDDASSIFRKQTLYITAFDSGYFVIPPVTVYDEKDTSKLIAASNPLLLTVQIMAVDTTKAIHDIKPIAEVPLTWRDFLPYIYALLGLILLVIIFLYVRSKLANRKKPVEEIKVPMRHAHEIALEALKELDSKKYWQQGQVKFYHAAISDIVRTYIEHRWSIPAMEQTTGEIVTQSVISSLNAESRENLQYILNLADLAKFAKFQPLANENEQAMRNAIEFVKSTIETPSAVNKEEIKV